MTVQELINILEKVPNKNMEVTTRKKDYIGIERYPISRISVEVNHRTGSLLLIENYNTSFMYEQFDKFSLSSPVEEYIILYEDIK